MQSYRWNRNKVQSCTTSTGEHLRLLCWPLCGVIACECADNLEKANENLYKSTELTIHADFVDSNQEYQEHLQNSELRYKMSANTISSLHSPLPNFTYLTFERHIKIKWNLGICPYEILVFVQCSQDWFKVPENDIVQGRHVLLLSLMFDTKYGKESLSQQRKQFFICKY